MLFFIVVNATALLLATWQQPVAPCRAEISHSLQQQVLSVVGQCSSLSPDKATYTYQLTIRKQGGGGQSFNAQRGSFELLPGQTRRLSQVQIGVGPGVVCRGELLILDAQGHIIARDSLHTPL